MRHQTWIVVAVLSIFTLFAAPAPQEKPEESREWIDKEKTLLELKRQLLEAELQKFEAEKKEWEVKKRAESIAREVYRLDFGNLPPDIRRRDALNRIVSHHFADLLNREDGGGPSGKLIFLKVRMDQMGKVTEVVIEKSELAEKIEKKITSLARSLDYSSLGSPLKPFEHRFPLVIRR